ncbi:MAG TPA: MoaD/ThiS family protein [Planctomycetota bacterium]|nr:MoaD/ThiS family protein [Planctomycetota bacterium]
MPTVTFTDNIQRLVSLPPMQVRGKTVKQALDQVFKKHANARSYVLDEHGAVRYHVVIFVNGRSIKDRETLSDKVPPDADVYVMQALSGG